MADFQVGTTVFPLPGARVASSGLAVILGCTSTPAAAIPSPDLLINLTASAAQTLGLLSVVAGGFA